MSQGKASRQAIARAQQLFASGKIAEAEKTLLSAIDQQRRDTALLDALAALYFETGRLEPAAQVLARLIAIAPAVRERYFTLAAVLEQLGQGEELIALYAQLTREQPRDAVAHFNHASYLRRAERLDDALAAYRIALDCGIEQPEEVWSNIGIIVTELRRDAEARNAFESALKLNRDWIPALYNLGLWHEEHGERDAARQLFRRVLELDSAHCEALARIAHLQQVRDPNDPLLAELERALGNPQLAAGPRESLHFALAKVLDECTRYESAFAHFRSANALGRLRLGAYDRSATESLFARVRKTFNREWLTSVTPVSQQPLLFVCGMFRSGSTLLEQMLAAHSAIQAGGEINYFNLQLRGNREFPEHIARDAGARRQLGLGYLDQLQRGFPGDQLVCNKRPDNFLYLGLVHALFPNARFLHTRRDPRDTCLSLYFQQLGPGLEYSCDLDDCAHFCGQYLALMQHWREMFAPRLLDIDYRNLVESPEPRLQQVCEFLGLDWEAQMLEFHQGSQRVRTASLWQVRRPLYRDALSRWRHYTDQIPASLELLSAQ